MLRNPSASTASVQTKIRLPKQLYDRLMKEAGRHSVSLKGEIAGRLEQTFEQGRLLDADQILGNLIRATEPLLDHNRTLNLQGDLIQAAKGLVDRIAPLLAARVITGPEGPPMREAVDKVLVAIKAIDIVNAERYRRKHTTGARS
jgi:hypothetical protein